MSDTFPDAAEPEASKPRNRNQFLQVGALLLGTPFGLAAGLIAILAVATLVGLLGGLIWSLIVAVVTALFGLLLIVVGFIAGILAVAVGGFVLFTVFLSLWATIMGASKGMSGAAWFQQLIKSLNS